MAQEPEQAGAAENVVQFTEVRRRRKSTVQNNQTMSEPKGAPQDDERPPDAA
jgi:hypothetical protein